MSHAATAFGPPWNASSFGMSMDGWRERYQRSLLVAAFCEPITMKDGRHWPRYARVKVPWQVHAYTGALDDAPRSPPRFDKRGLRCRVLPAAMTAHDAAAAGILHEVCPGAAQAGAAPPLALGQRAGQHDSATFFEPAGMLSAAPQPLPPHFLQPPSQQNLNAVSVRPALQRF